MHPAPEATGWSLYRALQQERHPCGPTDAFHAIFNVAMKHRLQHLVSFYVAAATLQPVQEMSQAAQAELGRYKSCSSLQGVSGAPFCAVILVVLHMRQTEKANAHCIIQTQFEMQVLQATVFKGHLGPA